MPVTSSAAEPAPSDRAEQRSDDLDVVFGGSLVGADAYTTTGGERMRGRVHRVEGGEQQQAAGGVRLGGGRQGLRFEAADLVLGRTSATTSFVAELELVPSADDIPATGAVPPATWFSAGGHLRVELVDGRLRYGFDGDDETRTSHLASVAAPEVGVPHRLSLHHVFAGDRAVLEVRLDGETLPPVVSAAPMALHPGLESTFGIGCDVHPERGGHGAAALVTRVRVRGGVPLDDPDRFRLQPATGDAPEEPEPFWVTDPVPAPPAGLLPGPHLALDPDDEPGEVLAKAALLRPSPTQLAWQELGLTAFLHVGMNTFYDQEWGHGTEDPARFAPTGELDVDGWVRTLRDTGHRLAVLVVKHHDGFLLYPSRYTRHTVAAAGWRDGAGDVVAEFTAACRRYGMRVGFYLSPADSHQEREGVFGNGSPRSERTIPTLVEGDDRAGADLPVLGYPATDYGAYFLNTLYEVLTGYGRVDEVWFDGAQGHTEHEEHYDYPAFYDLIGRLQPGAVIAVGGRDVRWVGNEAGLARQDEWAPVPVVDAGDGGKLELAGRAAFEDVGSRVHLVRAAGEDATALHWWPTESDMKLTPGWFAHPDDVPLSGPQLLEHHEATVGRGSVMLLNTPPTTTGALAPASVRALEDFAAERRRAFTLDHALGLPVAVPGGTTDRVTDDSARSSWASRTAEPGAVEIDLGRVRRVDRVVLAEGVGEHGQVVERHVVEAELDGGWTEVAAAGTIGVHRVHRLPAPVHARRFRVRVERARAAWSLARLGLYEQLADDPGRPTEVHLDCAAPVAGDGSPGRPFRSLEQLRDVELAPGATLHVAASDGEDSDTPFWGYGTPEAPVTVVVDAPSGPLFGTRTVEEVFAPLAEQGWVVTRR
ncbi:oxidoreductase [Desertihabitans brevis]|uniref:alpha-L-fucosidase n=1 Tax=Desertihabitans brevis TaxID=2268447 RepID=A0A367YS80_9ACTN|nr:alpha-L-fucosidase [Desertihabitans brevis]RCK68694.1 oxidoreductase [Desertihabitans brevis]